MRTVTVVLFTALLVVSTGAEAARKKKKSSARTAEVTAASMGAAAMTAAAAPSATPVRAEAPPLGATASAAPVNEVSVRRADRDPDGLEVEYRAQAEAGAFSGATVRRVSGGLVKVGGEAQLTWRSGAFRVLVPLELSHRQTLGAWLPETRGRLGLEGSVRLGDRGRAAVEAGALGVWRPNWDDLYQPRGDGTFAPTSRYSYVDPWLGARLTVEPAVDHRATLTYRFSRPDYLDDPTYDEAAEPMHITPSDHTRHEAEVKWRWSPGRLHVEGAADAYARYDRFLLARDALTGATHAGAGGLPPNPKQVLYGVEPSIEAGADLGALELEARYGHEVVVDAFQGYYSFSGPHPQVQGRYRFGRAVEAKVGAEAWLREYGPNSYAAGPGHPALEEGTRRWDRRVQVNAGVDWKLARHWIATLDVRWTNRVTNFPDYVPLQFPASRSYDIRWDYLNATVLVGMSYRP